MFVKGSYPQNVSTFVHSVTTNVVINRKTESNFGPKDEKFILSCHFYDVKEHIRPRCFTMMNFVKNHYIIHFQRKPLRSKIELKNKQKKVWVKKSNVNYFATFICLRTCANSGCSRHITGNQTILTDYKSVSNG